MAPRFDLWFWLVLAWALVVPYLFDAGHAASCDRHGRVVFRPLDELFGPGLPYACQRLPLTQKEPRPTPS